MSPPGVRFSVERDQAIARENEYHLIDRVSDYYSSVPSFYVGHKREFDLRCFLHDLPPMLDVGIKTLSGKAAPKGFADLDYCLEHFYTERPANYWSILARVLA